MPHTVPPQHRSPRARHTGRAGRGGWSGFVDRYGWRAYALPVLTIITIAALVGGSPAAARHSDAVAGGSRGVATSAVQAGGGASTSPRDEGNGGAGFRAGSTPVPDVINLKPDAITSCTTNSYPHLILVSIRRQRMWACDGAKQVNESPVTTGSLAQHDQTPLGSWRVQAKERNRYLVGPGYRDYVRYWVPFNGDFGLHDASWQTMPFGSAQWPTRGSHGCVHVPTSTMAWVYDWATVGGTVVTVQR